MGMTQISNPSLFHRFCKWLENELPASVNDRHTPAERLAGTELARRSGGTMHVCPIMFNIWIAQREGRDLPLRRKHREYLAKLYNVSQ